MALKTWDEFYPEVFLIASGCPGPIVDNYLRKSAIRLCEESKRLKYDMPAFDTVADTPTYALDAGTEMEPVEILDGMLDGGPIYPLRRDEITDTPNWKTETGQPTRFLMENDDATVRLVNIPDAVYSIELTLAIKPGKTATGIEAWFGNLYFDGIVSGALAQILALPNKTWTDPALSIYHDGIFQREISKASAGGVKDGTRAPLRTRQYGRF